MEWLQVWLMRAGTASYSNSRQSHSLLCRGKEKCVNLLTLAHGKQTILLSGTTSDATQNMAGFSMYKLVMQILWVFCLFVLVF